MKTPKTIIFIITFLFFTNAHAMTVEGYKELKAGMGDTPTQEQQLVMQFYFQGLAESVITFASTYDTPLDFGTAGQACIPSIRAISSDIMRTSLEDELQRVKGSSVESQFNQLPAGTVAIYGLRYIFPCE